MITIPQEQPLDVQGIREANISAFCQPQEADIVDELCRNCTDLLSLVAVRENRIVGHILLSPATIQSEDKILHGMALAPMGCCRSTSDRGLALNWSEQASRNSRNGIAHLRLVSDMKSTTSGLASNVQVHRESESSGMRWMMRS